MKNQKIENIINDYKSRLNRYFLEKSVNPDLTYVYGNYPYNSFYDIQKELIDQLEKTLTLTKHKIYSKHVSDMLISLKRNLPSKNDGKYAEKIYSDLFKDKYIYQVLVGMYQSYILKECFIPDRLFTKAIYY